MDRLTSGEERSLIDPLERAPSLTERVYDRLEEYIINGTLPPGERLREESLATRLGVSRNPVREALRALSRAGWVNIRHGRGAHVHEPDVQEVMDFFHVRMVLEVESARLAAERATLKDLRTLRQLVDAGRATLGADSDRLVEANRRFHEAVQRLAANQVLFDILEMLDKRLRWYFTPIVVERAPRSWEEHARLVESFAAHDADDAATVMRTHVRATTEAYKATRPGLGAT